MADRRDRRRGAPRWLVSAATGILATGAVAALAPACFGRECDGDSFDWGTKPGEGDMATPTVWESTPFDARWIEFPRKRFLRLQFPPGTDRFPVSIVPYIAAVEKPAAQPANGGLPDNYTVGSGNVAKILQSSPQDARVFNDSCSDYYIRVVVDFGPPKATPDAGAADAATPTPDASASDASDANAPDTGD